MIRRLHHVQLLGRREQLLETVESLQRAGSAEVTPSGAPDDDPDHAADHVARRDLLSRVQRVLEWAPADASATRDGADAAPVDPRHADVDIATLELEVESLRGAHASLEAERDALARYVDVLAQLESLVPELTSLSDVELELLGLAMTALVLDDPAGSVVELIETQLRQLVGEGFVLRSTEAGRTRGCLLVVARDRLPEVLGLMGADEISRVEVPEDYAHLSLHTTLVRMRERLVDLQDDLDVVRADLDALWLRGAPRLRAAERVLLVLTERDDAVASAALSARTFLLRCWIRADRRREVREQLDRDGLAGVAVVDAPAGEVPGPSPVELSGRAAWSPYRRLVGFLSWPSPGGLDPTGLMAIFLPFLFGVMVGDVVYGAALAGIGWWLRRRAVRMHDRGGVMDDAGRVLMAGGTWSVLWGVMFGEALGSLGNMWGMPALWFYRGGPAALEPLLVFAVALGWSHIVLGLTLGLVTALRRGDRHRTLEVGGTLAVLLGATAAIAAAVLGAPSWVTLAALVPAVVGLVATSSVHGPIGALLGPLELIGTVGNVLSYLRVAAVGLASVYLANVANELATELPLLVGLFVAVLLHLLNLGLAAFSPMVQALRLHYVEFFSKFHDGEGQAFRPLGAHGALTPRPLLRPVGVPPHGTTTGVRIPDATHER
ncbi:V-type ATP synthase subunit I [Jiangella muralis]|uniref:V-type ATP synthase subunit I n=1 Tax=Jiangella muralis TaxID=702383 RepID=UPI00069DFB22|nr:V-type ATPase 116kDa subunit family protein [Jiangella muralis]